MALNPAKQAAVAVAKNIEWRPFGVGEKVPSMGTSEKDVADALMATFDVFTAKTGQKFVRLKIEEGDDKVLRGMSAALKETDENKDKHPYRVLLAALEQHGEIQVNLWGY